MASPDYIDKNALTAWQELQLVQKKAMEELQILQEKQNDEFVEKFGLPAMPKSAIDNIAARYGVKAIRKHIDQTVLKWTTEMPDANDEELERLRGHVSMMSFSDLKEKAEENLRDIIRMRDEAREVNSINDIIDEPIAVKKVVNGKK